MEINLALSFDLGESLDSNLKYLKNRKVRFVTLYQNKYVESGLVIFQKKLKITAASILVGISISAGACVLPAQADTLDDELAAVKQKIAASQSTIDEHTSSLEKADLDVNAAQKDLDEARIKVAESLKRMEAAQSEADDAQAALQKAQHVFEESVAAVDSAKAEVEEQKKLVGEAARSELQQKSTLSGISIFFSSQNSSDLAKRAQWAKNVAGSTDKKLTEYENSLKKLEARQKEMEEAKGVAQSARDSAVASLANTQSIAAEARQAADSFNEKLQVVKDSYDAASKLLAAAVSDNEELKARSQKLSAEISERDRKLAAEAEAARQRANRTAAQAVGDWVTTNIAPGQIPPVSVQQALANAQALNGNPGFEGLCLALVANMYGYSTSGTMSAQLAANDIQAAGQMHTGGEIPVGALVFYNGWPAGNPYGHVALYAGNGMVWSNGANGGVGLMPISTPTVAWGEPMIGWSSVWLPNAR